MRTLFRYIRSHHVGLLALFIAMSGTAYAATLPRNSVGTKQLKKNAVTSAKVKNSSLRSADFKAGELPSGATGPAGSKGDTGPKGDPGPKGADGFDGFDGENGATNVVVRSSTATPVAVGTTGSATAQCQAGERATGGGADVGGLGENGTVVVDSQPTPTGGTPTGWTVKVTNASNLGGGAGAASDVVARVVCASP